MGEAKIRKELGLPPKALNQNKIIKEERLFLWSPWPT
tara:strand:- start:721 stop:831 length:111 start_codon:yes stop_codon:yes gene_type:complete